MKLLRTLMMPLLALAAGVSLYAEEPVLELSQASLPPGVYKAYYLGNPNATYPCAYVPANNCLIIVLNVAGQNLNATDNTIGPVAAVKPSTDPAWRWEAVTTQENRMFMDPAPPTGD